MIGLDGADGALLDRWSSDGSLPNLGALRARGSVRRLSAPPGISDDALWASFEYGAQLGEHGRFHWRQRLSSGEMGMAYRDEENREAFWESLSREGRRIAVIDVPKCGPPRPIDGIHLVDWLVHGRYFLEPRSEPPELAADVLERFGPAPPSLCAYELPDLTDPQVLDVTEHLLTSVARKRAAGLHFLSREPWDLFVIGFKEAHCASHLLWHLADPSHEDYDADRASRLGHPVSRILEALDAAVGALCAEAGPTASLVVFSTTDMEPSSSLSHLMPALVEKINREMGETSLRRFARRIRGKLSGRPSGPVVEILPYNENCTALRLNPATGLLGHPSGQDDLAARLLGEVDAMLRELVDADSGEPIVSAIDRPSRQQKGERAEGLPDLLVRYPPGTVPRAIRSTRLGRVEAGPPSLRAGDHAAGGILFSSEVPGEEVASMADLGAMAAALLS